MSSAGAAGAGGDGLAGNGGASAAEGGTAGVGEGEAGGAAGTAQVAGQDASVTVFDKAHIYFTGSDNKREVDADATFPADGLYEKITLHIKLECPAGGCDPWDRFASIGIVTAKGDGMMKPDTVVEIARYITPFHVGATWDEDITELRPLLSGPLTLRAFIDTWVGPGSQFGGGWQLSVSVDMKGGIPAKVPVAAVPVWLRHQVTYGDPSKPIATSVPAQSLTLPGGATSYALRTFITGHGQGNAGNCAEFCSKKHTLTAGKTAHEQQVWRTDCATTAAPGQQGTYKYSRSGWCPGADVAPWKLDVTSDVAGGSTAMIAYDVESYENTCRPDAAMCTGCTIGASCAYDGGTHTEPNFQISTLLIAYQ